MKEKIWIKPLPKIEKELELLNSCANIISATAMLEPTPQIGYIHHHCLRIVQRYIEQLDRLTENDTNVKMEIDLDEDK